MPVTINGNGSISGLSVGGLPDGTVDADTLATSAVTSTKLASGTGGKILQVVGTEMTGTETVSMTTTYMNNTARIHYITGLDTTITTTVANSKILFSAMVNGEPDQPDRRFGFIIGSEVGGTAVHRLFRGADAYSGGSYGGRPSITQKCATGPLNGSGAVGTATGDSFAATNNFPNFLYSPNAAAGTAIKMRVGCVCTENDGRKYYVNRTVTDSNTLDYVRLCSTMTLMEVSP